MRALISISVVLSSAYLAVIAFQPAPGSPLPVPLKVASIGLLIVLAVASNQKLLVAALAFSATGDFLLELKHLGSLGPSQLFLLGLISFFVAHVLYCALFLKAKSPAPIGVARKIACGVVIMTTTASLRVLWPGLAEMRGPVFAYSMVLSAMAITAQLARFSRMVAVGALSFLASDTMLALSIFGHPFPGSRPLVWITYYAAQVMIAVGVTSASKRFSASA
jgi:uncharacterized membrane protein YhhN